MVSAAALHQVITTPRDRRRAHVRRRSFAILASLLREMPQVRFVGPDPMFRRLALEHGVDPVHIAPFEVLASSGPLTVVAALNTIWYSPPLMAKLKDAICNFDHIGRRCVVVPQRALERLNSADPSARARFVLELIATGPDPTVRFACTPGTFHDPSGCRATLLATGRHCHR